MRPWAASRKSRASSSDFAALCACGGRFSGTESEVRARELLANRVADATRQTVQRGRVQYGVGARPCPAHPPRRAQCGCAGFGAHARNPPQGLTARLVDLGRGTPGDVGSAEKTGPGAIVLARHEFMMSGAVTCIVGRNTMPPAPPARWDL